jgi:hypothetical protein
VALASIGLLKKALILALQLLLQNYPFHPAAVVSQVLSSLDIGSEQPAVVRQLPGPRDAGIERLAVALMAISAMLFEQSEALAR